MVTVAILEDCPFSPQKLPCEQSSSGDCEVRKKAEALVKQRIAENMEDYWKHQNSGAER